MERTFKTNTVFFEAIETIAGTLDLEHVSHPFTHAAGSIGVIAMTSDTGLLGGLNQQVISTAIQEYRRSPGELIVVGERGASYVREQGLPCHVFPGALDHERQTLAGHICDYAVHQVLTRGLGALTIVYPRALSFSLQRVELVRALPCREWFRTGQSPRRVQGGPVLLESSLQDILEYLVRLWVGQKVFEVLGLSRLAELAARSVHLESSSQELQRRGQKLWLRYFRERHEVIDRNMRELFAARSLSGSSPEEQVTDAQ